MCRYTRGLFQSVSDLRAHISTQITWTVMCRSLEDSSRTYEISALTQTPITWTVMCRYTSGLFQSVSYLSAHTNT